MLNRTPPRNRRPEHTHTPLPSSSCRDDGILRGYGPNASRSIKSDPTHHQQRGGGGISAVAQAGDPISPNRPIHWLTSSFYFIFYVSYIGIDRLRVKMMNNGTPPPAPHDAIAIGAQPRWLFPLERAPPPPHNEGCTILHGFGNPAPLPSNGSPPPCPPMIMMSPLPSSPTSTCAATSSMQTVPPPERHTALMKAFNEAMDNTLRRFQEEIREAFLRPIKEVIRREVDNICYERLIRDKPSEAFLWIKEVHDVCAAPLDVILAEIAHDETVHDASRHLLTTARPSQPSANEKMTLSPSSAATKSSSPTPPCPTSSSMGTYTPLMGGDPLTSTPALQASLSTHASTAITPSQMARRRNRPRRRPGRRHRPRAPDPTDGAIPSHPGPQLLIMGGTLPPTATIPSARAAIPTRSASPTTLVTPSPSLQPFIMTNTDNTYSGGSLDDTFRDCGDQRKSARRKPYHRRVCRHHGPRAPNSTGSLCGRRHRPRAPSTPPEAF